MTTTNLNMNTDNIEDPKEEEVFIKEESDGSDNGSGNGQPRDKWGSNLEFLLAIIGYTIGIASIWRFPIMCAKNGGGAFLVPYFFFLFVIGSPLYYLELNIGQFSGKSACKAFEYCRLFKGIGYLMTTLNTLVLWYFMVILAWINYFLVSSFSPTLPWASCGHWWNTPDCKLLGSSKSSYNSTDPINSTAANVSLSTVTSGMQQTNPAFEFWTYNVLRKSSGLEDMGSVQVHLVLSLFAGWTITILCVIKGVRSLGKVVYFTAIFPYVLLAILFVRGVTLDGHKEGLTFFLMPDFTKLVDVQVWIDAAIMVFYSLGTSWGSVITMASYNNFHQKTFKETCIVCCIDGFTSLFSGLVVFAIIGFMSKETGIPVQELAKSSGPGLAFVAYPTAVTLMPLPQLWSVLFFFMMLLVMLDSAFAMLETVVSALIDEFPRYLHDHRVMTTLVTGIVFFLFGIPFTTNFAMLETVVSALIDEFPRYLHDHRVVTTLLTGIVFFMFGIPFITNGGLYLFQLVDWYSTAFCLLVGTGLESTTISWIYGIDRFSEDIAMMTGAPLSRVARLLWSVVVPVFTSITFVFVLAQYSEPDYGDGYTYKPYAITIGICIGMLPIINMVLVGARELFKAPGNIIQRFAYCLQPSTIWVPHDTKAAEIYRKHPYIYESSFTKRFLKNIWGSDDKTFF